MKGLILTIAVTAVTCLSSMAFANHKTHDQNLGCMACHEGKSISSEETSQDNLSLQNQE